MINGLIFHDYILMTVDYWRVDAFGTDALYHTVCGKWSFASSLIIKWKYIYNVRYIGMAHIVKVFWNCIINGFRKRFLYWLELDFLTLARALFIDYFFQHSCCAIIPIMAMPPNSYTIVQSIETNAYIDFATSAGNSNSLW